MRKLILGGLLALLAGPVQALDDGENGVWLQSKDGARIRIATVTAKDDRYDLQMNDTAFGEYFLSMRPFKCVEGPEMLWCHVPYPYEIKRNISEDVTDLEYDFLFIWKPAGSYGIDMWNGLYYELEGDQNTLTGTLHELDMNVLSVPPKDGNLRPLTAKHLEPGDADSHWLPQLVIGPAEE